MNRDNIVAALNEEIARLTTVRDMMAGSDDTPPRRPGRPKGSANKSTSFNPGEFAPRKRRSMSPESKARIAAGQRKRWAAQKSTPVKRAATRPQAAVKKNTPTPAKKTASKPSTRTAVKKTAAEKSAPRRVPVKAAAQAAGE